MKDEPDPRFLSPDLYDEESCKEKETENPKSHDEMNEHGMGLIDSNSFVDIKNGKEKQEQNDTVDSSYDVDKFVFRGEDGTARDAEGNVQWI